MFTYHVRRKERAEERLEHHHTTLVYLAAIQCLVPAVVFVCVVALSLSLCTCSQVRMHLVGNCHQFRNIYFECASFCGLPEFLGLPFPDTFLLGLVPHNNDPKILVGTITLYTYVWCLKNYSMIFVTSLIDGAPLKKITAASR